MIRSDDGEREEDLRDAGRAAPDGEVLASPHLGHQHHQPGPQGCLDILRPSRSDDPHGNV